MTYVNKERLKSSLTGFFFFVVLAMLRCYQGGGLTLLESCRGCCGSRYDAKPEIGEVNNSTLMTSLGASRIYDLYIYIYIYIYILGSVYFRMVHINIFGYTVDVSLPTVYHIWWCLPANFPLHFLLIFQQILPIALRDILSPQISFDDMFISEFLSTCFTWPFSKLRVHILFFSPS